MFLFSFFKGPKKNSSKKLFCDIDSTVNDHWLRIKKWSIGRHPPRKIDEMAFSEQEVLKDKVAFESQFWISEFKKAGWEIHWISARPKSLYRATYLWLKRNNFPVDSLRLVNRSHDKVPYLKKNKVDLFVDDFTKGQENDVLEHYTEVIEELKNTSIPFVVFERDWGKIFKQYNK